MGQRSVLSGLRASAEGSLAPGLEIWPSGLRARRTRIAACPAPLSRESVTDPWTVAWSWRQLQGDRIPLSSPELPLDTGIATLGIGAVTENGIIIVQFHSGGLQAGSPQGFLLDVGHWVVVSKVPP